MTTTTADRIRAAARADSASPGPPRLWADIAAEVADTMVAEALEELAARDVLAGPDPLAELGAAMLHDSAAWFPIVHARGHQAVEVHFGLGVAGEAGEVADVVKKADVCGLVDTCTMHAPGKHGRAALASELADVLTYTLALAAHEGIDLVAAYAAKRAENVGRWGDTYPRRPAGGGAR